VIHGVNVVFVVRSRILVVFLIAYPVRFAAQVHDEAGERDIGDAPDEAVRVKSSRVIMGRQRSTKDTHNTPKKMSSTYKKTSQK
jgi:hypothetical protein